MKRHGGVDGAVSDWDGYFGLDDHVGSEMGVLVWHLKALKKGVWGKSEPGFGWRVRGYWLSDDWELADIAVAEVRNLWWWGRGSDDCDVVRR